MFALLLLRCAAAEVALAALGAWAHFPTDLLGVLAAHLDFQKHFDPDVLQRPAKDSPLEPEHQSLYKG